MCSVIVCQLFVVLWLWTVAAIGPTGMGVFRGVLQVQPSNEFFTVKNRTKFYANAPHSKPLFCFLSTPLPTAGLFPAPAQRLMDPMNMALKVCAISSAFLLKKDASRAY